MAGNRGVAYIKPGVVEIQKIDFPKLYDPARKKKVEHNAIRVPLTGNIQINVLDPDGNHIEVQFGAAEAESAPEALDRTGDASPALPTRRKKVKQLA